MESDLELRSEVGHLSAQKLVDAANLGVAALQARVVGYPYVLCPAVENALCLR